MSKRGKRLFPKQYSAGYVKTSRIDPNKAAAYNLQRSKATFGARSDSLHNPDSNFMQEVPATKNLSTFDPELLDGKTAEPMRRRKKHQPMWPSERKKVLDKKKELVATGEKDLYGLYKVWQGQRRQGVSEYYKFPILRSGSNYSLMLFFSGNEFLFISESSGIRSISRTYIGREEAMYRYYNNKIAWITEEKI